jgi:hypothetical protein
MLCLLCTLTKQLNMHSLWCLILCGYNARIQEVGLNICKVLCSVLYAIFPHEGAVFYYKLFSTFTFFCWHCSNIHNVDFRGTLFELKLHTGHCD